MSPIYTIYTLCTFVVTEQGRIQKGRKTTLIAVLMIIQTIHSAPFSLPSCQIMIIMVCGDNIIKRCTQNSITIFISLIVMIPSLSRSLL